MAKKVFLCVVGCLLFCYNCALADQIIFRDGKIVDVQILLINDSKLVYATKANKNLQQEVSLKDVYMYNTNSIGNTYVTPDCKRFTGEQSRPAKGLNILYLVSGKEIGAINIIRNMDEVTYTYKEKAPGQSKPIEVSNTVPVSEVFMILYKNGMSEILTPIDNILEPVVEESKTKEPEEPMFKVIYHDVKRGDTLNSLAEKYDVTPSEIIEKNDLPENTRKNAQLKIGSQLMIYVQINK